MPVLVVGAPLRHRHRIYNTAVVIHRGRVLGVVPKSYLPTYREFYESRQFAAGDDERGTIRLGGEDVPFGPDLLFAADGRAGLRAARRDLRGHVRPGPAERRGGAGRRHRAGQPVRQPHHRRARRRPPVLARSASSRCLAAYVYAAAGEGESTTDLAWDGQTMIYENGVLLAESERFPKGERRRSPTSTCELLRSERLRMGTFDDNRRHHADAGTTFRPVEFTLDPPTGDIGFRREVERFPFVPADPAASNRIATRPTTSRCPGSSSGCGRSDYPKVVIGVSGGLDSTHALIVAARAMDREGARAATSSPSPCPASRRASARRPTPSPAEALGVTSRRSTSRSTAELMLTRDGHPFSRGEPVYDVTFENVQAGLRTDYLFRLANQRGGIVLGTGDLSELALGWSTYGVGDQMSHYNVNGGVPKTLIQHLIRWVISSHQFDDDVDEVLQSVLDTEISPELVPADATRNPDQRGEGRPLCAAGFHPLPGAALRIPSVEDRVPGLARVA